jgi:polyhydroxyalkanoate synthesis regulator phasin
MAGLSDIVQKAFYLGIGLAASAGEQAGEKMSVLRVQAQKLADEMVAKGELTTDEARKLVDEMIKSAQQPNLNQSENSTTDRPKKSTEPRRIEIVSEGEEATPANDDVDAMRKQLEALQEELKRLKKFTSFGDRNLGIYS